MPSDTWERIERVLYKRRRSWSSVYQALGYTKQRVQNWKTRGIPADVLPDIARELQVTLDYLTGLADETATPVAVAPLVAERPAAYEVLALPSIDQAKVARLSRDDRLRLETAVLLAAAQLGLDIAKESTAGRSNAR